MAKGSQFERDIAKYISQWILQDKNAEILIWRSSNSGGQATFSRMRGKRVQKNMEGDLIAIDSRANFFMDRISVECKNGYKKASIFSLFKNSKSDVLKAFWEQCQRETKESKKVPMLVFKPLGNSPLVGFPEKFVKSCYPEILELGQVVSVKFNNELPVLVLAKLSDIFETIIKPDTFTEQTNKYFI